MNDATVTGRITAESVDRDFMQIRYTDLIGKFLAKYIQIDKDLIQDVFRKGIGLDGSSVIGFSIPYFFSSSKSKLRLYISLNSP